MKSGLMRKFGQSLLRIAAALAVVPGIPALIYLFWQPGSDEPLPEYSGNAIWIEHGWLGDDGWFARNRRDKADFRSEEKIAALFRNLSDNHVSTVYPHLCPAQMNGTIAPYDNSQLGRFPDVAEKYDMKVIPRFGGVFEESARIADRKWRRNFIVSIEDLLQKHPRLAGIQINIEPMPSGEADFLTLPAELCPKMPGRILSVAAYPPPTRWQPHPNMHWELQYISRIARRCDQMAVMMYDTAIPLDKFYVKLMVDWTRQLAETTHQTGCELIIEIPAYDDAGVGYHRPEEENVASALRGISASSRTGELKGIAIYCEWEMDEAQWQIWQKVIRGSAPDMRPEVPPGKPPTGEAAALPMSFCNTVPRMLYY